METKIELLICMGSSCFSRGNNRTLEAVRAWLEEKGLGDRISLKGSRCEGRCNDGPNIAINGVYHGDITPEKAISLIEGLIR